MPDASLATAAPEPAMSRATPARDRGAVARPPNRCSRIGTGRARFLRENGNSAESRRLGEIIEELSRPWSGAMMPDGVRRDVKRLALLTLAIEEIGGDRTRGLPIDRVALSALNNQATRLEDRLRAAAPIAKAPGQSFDEHMARLAREEAS